MRNNNDLGALSGSRASTEPSSTVSALAGFDPERGRGLFPLNGFAPGGYMGTCHSCGQTVYDIAKRSLRCLPCAIADLKEYHTRVERALRVRIWNEGKVRGLSDRAAMQAIHDELHAIATEARRAETGELGSVHEGAGLKGIAKDMGQ